MAQFGRPYATFYWSAIVNIALSCDDIIQRQKNSKMVRYYSRRDFEIGVRGHSMSLKLVPFESLGAVSYSLSTVTRGSHAGLEFKAGLEKNLEF